MPTPLICAAYCAGGRAAEMLLQAEAAGLAGLTVVLAGPASTALAKAAWPARSPRAALLLWQAVGLGGGLGILTAGMTLAAASMDRHWLPGLVQVPSHWSALGIQGWCGVGLTACVGAWLIAATTTSAARVLLARRSHRRRLDLIAEAGRVPAGAVHGGGLNVRLVDYPRALAYCLPGIRPQVVLSRTALQTLSSREVAAVLAHENAHARGRHDLVIQPFIAWSRTFPFLRSAARSVAAVRLLIEMLADDAALQSCRPDSLRSALQRVADGGAGVLGGDDAGVVVRLRRLTGSTDRLPRSVTAAIYAAALILVVAPPVLLLLS